MHTVIKNSLWLVLDNLCHKVVFFVIAIFLSKFLGIQAYGQYSFVASILFFFAVFTDFGISQFLIREVARKNLNDSKLSTLFTAQYVLIAISFSLLLLIVFVSGLDPKVKLLTVLYAPYSLVYIPINNIRNIFRGCNKTFFDFLINSSINMLLILLILTYFNSSVFQVILGQNIALLIGIVIGVVVLKKYYLRPQKLHIRISFDRVYFHKVIRETLPLLISIFATAIYFKIDIIMLGFFKGVEQVAVYNVSYNFIFLMTSFIVLCFESIYPKLSTAQSMGQKYFNVSMHPLFILSIVLAYLLFLFGKSIIQLAFGGGFENSFLVLIILLASVPFWVFNKFFSYYLSTIHKQSIYTMALLLGVVINIIFNLCLLPRYGYYGAAFATLAAEAMIYFYLFFIVRRQKKEISTMHWPIIIGSMIFLFSVFLLQLSHILILGFVLLNLFLIRKNPLLTIFSKRV